MTDKEIIINYLSSIRRNYERVLETQIECCANSKFKLDTMQYLVAIDVAIEAVERKIGGIDNG